MEFKDLSKFRINRKLCYFLICLGLLVPIGVGVAMWFLIPRCSQSPSTPLPPSSPPSFPPDAPPPRDSPRPDDLDPWMTDRVERDALPTHYDVILYPELDTGHFYGNETVEYEIVAETRYLYVHIRGLNVTQTGVRERGTGAGIRVARSFLHSAGDLWVVECDAHLAVGNNVLLDLTFSGTMTSRGLGLVLTSVQDSARNQSSPLLEARLAPGEVRRVFPCLDLAGDKAEFSLTVLHPASLTPVSNTMPEEEPTRVEWSRDLVATHFERSGKMSPCHVSLVLGDFRHAETSTDSGIRVRMFVPPGRQNLTQWPLEVSRHSLKAFQSLLDFQYPLTKLDLVVVPSTSDDVTPGWGAVTVDESAVLQDPRMSSSRDRQRSALVVARVVALQFVGCSVSMERMSDRWLTSGLASLLSYMGLDMLEPDWSMMGQFLLDSTLPALTSDSDFRSVQRSAVRLAHGEHPHVTFLATSTPPPSAPAVPASDLQQKGAAVARMLLGILGKEKFFKGLATFLMRFQLGTARPSDLWQTLSEVEGAPDVTHMVTSWTEQSGIPLVSLTLSPTAGGRTLVSASQKPYTDLPSSNPEFPTPHPSLSRNKWYIPLNYVTSEGQVGKRAMDMGDAAFYADIDLRDHAKWMKFNVNSSGAYRVLYPEKAWRRFSEILYVSRPRAWALQDADRAGLLNDALSLARTGHVGYGVVLELTRYLRSETSHVVWAAVAPLLRHISLMLEEEVPYQDWRAYILEKVRPLVDYLTWDDRGGHPEKLMRATVIELACFHGDDSCISNATQRFRRWIDQNREPDGDVRAVVLRYGQQQKSSGNRRQEARGGNRVAQSLWRRLQQEGRLAPRQELLTTLAASPSPPTRSRLLDYIRDETGIRLQDVLAVLEEMGEKTESRDQAWDWLQENWQHLQDRLLMEGETVEGMVETLARHFTKQRHLQEMDDFFSRHVEVTEREKARALAAVRRNIAWLARSRDPIQAWLQRRR